ncbi:N-acetyl-gamma-glutamyl-phosphate reductase, partial [candidate division FCPU426 bacterium]|nr:N-acetyl-gamma-glutamyl-phosphate reductase [candidate division FCPU426 bacterium]
GQVRVVAATSEASAGRKLSDLYPGLGPAGDIPLSALAKTELTSKTADVVFLGLPHGESMHVVPDLLKAGIKVIDLSGDYRFNDTSIYETWYKRKHTAKEMAAKAVYGLPELFREEIKGASLVANPGCYVTAAVLALYPLVKADMVELRTIIVDAKSGISGAGHHPKAETHFNRIAENVVPYKMAGTHQHTPEIEETLSLATGQEVSVAFTPQLVAARRGILAVAYSRLKKEYSEEQVQEVFRAAYQKEPFVRFLAGGDEWPNLSSAVGSNFCVIKVDIDSRTGWAISVASLDNLIKGASGQAIQNMNLMLGLEETAGLSQIGLIP